MGTVKLSSYTQLKTLPLDLTLLYLLHICLTYIPLFKELNWLSLQSRITYHVALLVFKIHNDLAPNYLKTILLFTSNSCYELRSESRCHLA